MEYIECDNFQFIALFKNEKKTGSDLRLIANHPVFQFEEDFFHSLFF